MHPTSRELAQFVDGERDDTTRNHLRQCAYCRSLVNGAAAPIDVPTLRVGWEPVTVEVASPTASMPTLGDVWRVVWNEVHHLAVVLGESESGVSVVPVVPDLRTADEWTVLLAAPEAGTGFDLAVQVSQRFFLPLFVFDACVAQLSGESQAIVDSAASDYRSGRPTSARTGPDVFSILDERVEEAGALTDDFVSLAEANWYSPPAAVDTNWAALLNTKVVDTHRVLELSRGAQPTPDEIAAAADVGIQLGQAPLHDDLVQFLNRPQHSGLLRRLASKRSISESQIRADAAERMTNRRFALAARGGDGSFDWTPLFQEFVDAARG